LTIYDLKFGDQARREWNRLDSSIQRQFKKKLDQILINPHIPSARLHGYKNSYRIKLRKAGYRLGYRVIDEEITVLVIAVGRRDKDEVYDDFALRYNAGY
jgi:mRNA interferase RelE/StbE